MNSDFRFDSEIKITKGANSGFTIQGSGKYSGISDKKKDPIERTNLFTIHEHQRWKKSAGKHGPLTTHH
jgi:hypothetical protein